MKKIVGDVPLGGSAFPPIAEYAFLSDCETTALVDGKHGLGRSSTCKNCSGFSKKESAGLS